MRLSEPYIVVIVIALALLLLWWWGSTKSRRREKEIVSARPSDTLETFIASFRLEVQDVARAMYAEFQGFTYNGKFPFRKSDRVAAILSIDKVDLEEALQRVANQFGCRKPAKVDESKFRGRATFEDFIEFIHHLKASEVPVSSE